MSGLERLWGLLQKAGYDTRAQRNAPLAPYTTYGVGGPADVLIIAETIDELATLVQMAHAAGVPGVVLGAGSNVLVADAGVRGLVILNRCVQHRIDDDGVLVAESGADLRKVARATVDAGWAGLDWAVGVPGSVGGGVVGNAGAYGGCIADNLLWVDVALPDGSRALWGRDEMGYGYRTSALKRLSDPDQRPVVLQAAFQLVKADPTALQERVRAIQTQRLARTPAGRCAGSVFKRTLHYPAGFLIEQAGLKGRRVGDAVVSDKHANFIMNEGRATAAEIRELILLVQREVQQQLGELLEPEIEFVGAWDSGEGGAGTSEERER
ncbi:MAG: UDP-N-acetylmuramate dehydrogenase [Anaerolineae bacterium]|jgi:UDP-N-acetylmuramate dehydrogenase